MSVLAGASNAARPPGAQDRFLLYFPVWAWAGRCQVRIQGPLPCGPLTCRGCPLSGPSRLGQEASAPAQPHLSWLVGDISICCHGIRRTARAGRTHLPRGSLAPKKESPIDYRRTGLRSTIANASSCCIRCPQAGSFCEAPADDYPCCVQRRDPAEPQKRVAPRGLPPPAYPYPSPDPDLLSYPSD